MSDETNKQTGNSDAATAHDCNWITVAICWFAVFPYEAYRLISTPSLRARVMANGLAVMVSPLVFTMALVTNGAAIVGHSPYLYLLPVVAFSIDRLLVAVSYTVSGRSAWLTVVRGLILSISLIMAVLAGLLSESTNLFQRLYAKEDAVTMQSAEAQNLAGRLKVMDDQTASNEKALMERSSIQSERLAALRLQEMECKGKGGVDPKTGVIIKGGGKCGENAETHRINASAAEARLEQLNSLEKDSKTLLSQRTKLNDELTSLLKSRRSPADSIASLGRSLNEADSHLWIKIGMLVLCVMTAEAFAFIMSEVPVPQTLQVAVQYSESADRTSLEVWRESTTAKVVNKRATLRAQAADGLPTLDVRLAAVPKPASEASKEPLGGTSVTPASKEIA